MRDVKPWEWTYEVNDNAEGGLVLTDVYHDIFPLAREIRVARIWVNPDLPAGLSSLTPGPLAAKGFGLGDSEWCSVLHQRQPVQNLKAPAPFCTYKALKGEWAEFETNFPEVTGAIKFQQQYLFSGYNRDPPHEPTGGLAAARLMPLLRFETSDPGVRQLRADYKLSFRLNRAVNGLGPKAVLNETGNQVGIFRDFDDVPTNPVAQANTAIVVAEHGAPFAAVEKPLGAEVLAIGLQNGKGEIQGRRATWDSIHQWAKSNKLPSAPGMFYGMHLHWRWGRATYAPKPAELEVLKELLKKKRDIEEKTSFPAGSFPWLEGMAKWATVVFQNLEIPPTELLGSPLFGAFPLNGALIDPLLADQTIEFMIVRANRSADPSADQQFGSTLQKSDVADFSKAGDDIDLWISFTVNRPTGIEPWHGDFFPQGFYFPHEDEQRQPFESTAGKEAHGPPRPPRKKNEWFLSASPPLGGIRFTQQ